MCRLLKVDRLYFALAGCVTTPAVGEVGARGSASNAAVASADVASGTS